MKNKKPKLKGTGIYFSQDRRLWVMAKSRLTIHASVDVRFYRKDGEVVGTHSFMMPMTEEMVKVTKRA